MFFSLTNLTYNPGCAGREKLITVLSQSKSSEQDSTREITAHDGLKGTLTDESAVTSKHGHDVDTEDSLPPNPNQKPTLYYTNRFGHELTTRIKKNLRTFWRKFLKI